MKKSFGFLRAFGVARKRGRKGKKIGVRKRERERGGKKAGKIS